MFLPGGSQGREAWWAAIYGVTQSDTTEATQQQQQGRLWDYSRSLCFRIQSLFDLLAKIKCGIDHLLLYFRSCLIQQFFRVSRFLFASSKRISYVPQSQKELVFILHSLGVICEDQPWPWRFLRRKYQFSPPYTVCVEHAPFVNISAWWTVDV